MLCSQANDDHRGIASWRGRRWLVLLLVALVLVPAGLEAKKKDKELAAAIAALPQKYQDWLRDVQYLISEDEKALFVEIEKDYQRDAFIERFWQVRDPHPRTARNELRDEYEVRLQNVQQFLGGNLKDPAFDDRARIYLLNGPPAERIEVRCTPYMWPVEVWYYAGSDTVGFEFLLLFYQRFGSGNFRLWEPFDGTDELASEPGLTADRILNSCGEKGRAVVTAINFMGQGGQASAASLLSRIQKRPDPPEKEWVETFATYTTDLPADARTFDARLELAFPGRNQSRTVVQGTVLVPVNALGQAQVRDYAAYALLLTGEVLAEGKLFESFRYRYDFPLAEVQGDTLPLVFQRYLRPGNYTLVVKLEDVNGGGFHRLERALEVPTVTEVLPPAPTDPETARILAEANAAIESGETTLQIVPLGGQWQTGLVRIDTLSTGDDLASVTFVLDGQPILTKKQPPYNVELDLGAVPRARVLRVEGYNAAGEEIASDEQMINAGNHRFSVRLEEPRRGKTYKKSLRAEAEVTVPEGGVVAKVEFYLNETLVSTLYQAPWIQPIILPDNEAVAYVRAVAYTPDGSSTEDLVFVNAPDYLEEVDVDFVELYTTVTGRDGRPVENLEQGAFTVFEDGVQQQVVRFEQVRDLPIHVAVMLDVSASMEEELAGTQAAALSFFEQAITPKDRAAIVTFNDHPNLAAKFTNDPTNLSAGLAGLKAERGTALYDSLIFTLYYFNGIKGQRAILLLSDGKDESSRFDFDDALEFSQRAGVAIYTIALKLSRKDGDARRGLEKLADTTGGRSFEIESSSELAAVYEAIQRELRSRYLLAYQSSNTSGDKGFRAIEVKVAQPGLEAKTLRGYYP